MFNHSIVTDYHVRDIDMFTRDEDMNMLRTPDLLTKKNKRQILSQKQHQTTPQPHSL